jgi:hypothetical protein
LLRRGGAGNSIISKRMPLSTLLFLWYLGSLSPRSEHKCTTDSPDLPLAWKGWKRSEPCAHFQANQVPAPSLLTHFQHCRPGFHCPFCTKQSCFLFARLSPKTTLPPLINRIHTEVFSVPQSISNLLSFFNDCVCVCAHKHVCARDGTRVVCVPSTNSPTELHPWLSYLFFFFKSDL